MGARRISLVARLACSAVVAVPLALAGDAGARIVVPVRGDLVHDTEIGELTLSNNNVALAGSDVVFTQYGRLAIPEVRLLRRDGSVRTLAQFAGPLRVPGYTVTEKRVRSAAFIGGQSLDVAASGSNLLVLYRYESASGVVEGYRAGRLSGRAPPWVRCREWVEVPAVSGLATAYVGCERKNAVAVRDGGEEPRWFTAADGWVVHDIALAGRFLAIHSAPPCCEPADRQLLQVFDWRSGQEAYRVPGSFEEMALQADGKAVVSEDIPARVVPNCGDPRSLTWYRPEEPGVAHVLSARACGWGGRGLAIARDRIVFRRPAGNGSLLWMTDVSDRAPLQLSDGPWATPGGDNAPPFAFDGTRIAYLTGDCTRQRLVRDTVRAIETNGPGRSPTCPVRFAGPIRQLGDGRLEIEVVCPRGCIGSWDVMREDGRKQLIPGDYFRLRPGVRTTLRSSGSAFPARYRGRARLRRRVPVTVWADQPDATERRAIRRTTVVTTRPR
jgi:hypothetical protein